MPNNKDYIVVQGWMINELNLNGNELLSFALIYGFCKDGQSEFTGSLNYLCDWLNCSRNTAIKSLNDLMDKNLIKKKQVEHNKVIFNKYSVSEWVVQKMDGGSSKTALGGSAISGRGGSSVSAPNNTILNNTNIDNTKDNNINTCFSFESFWNLYPNKNNKKGCESKYKKLTESQRAKISATLPSFLAYKPFASYTPPHPLTYLNQERWEDEIKVKEEKSIKWD
jgi:hypothetical protein